MIMAADRAGPPQVVVAVCRAEDSGARPAEIIDALRPVVRATRGAILVRAQCWHVTCLSRRVGTTCVLVQSPADAATGSGDPQVHEMKVRNGARCATLVSRLLAPSTPAD